jgi:hypothetical protein
MIAANASVATGHFFLRPHPSRLMPSTVGSTDRDGMIIIMEVITVVLSLIAQQHNSTTASRQPKGSLC